MIRAIILVIALSLTWPLPIKASELKKVLILEIQNQSGKESFGYLERSLADAIRKKLKGRYAFAETPRVEWEAVAQENFIFKQDHHTMTAAMSLGLLARQDIVVAGRFTVQGEQNPLIATEIRIMDISNKKQLALLKDKGPADATIWQTLDKVVVRIADELAQVLPDKEGWQRQAVEKPGEPWLTNGRAGLHAGGSFFAGGYADTFNTNQPTLGITLAAHAPLVHKQFFLGADLFYVGQTLADDANTRLNELNLVANIANFFVSGYVGYEHRLDPVWSLRARAGAGLVLQQREVQGQFSSSDTNSFPVINTAVDGIYRLNNKFGLLATYRIGIELEEGTTTVGNFITIGGEYYF